MDNTKLLLTFLALTNPDKLTDFIRKIVFHPPTPSEATIRALPEIFSVPISTLGSELIYGNVIKSDQPSDLYAIYSHGTNNDLDNVNEHLVTFANKFKINIIVYDYPGYGISTSQKELIDEKGCYMAHEAIIDYALNTLNIEKNKIILVGQSLGTGVVVDYVASHEWDNQVILLSPYKSIPSLVIDDQAVARLANRFQFDSLSKAKDVKCPVHIFHGRNDNLIPVSHAEALSSSIKSSTLQIVEDAAHADIMDRIDEKKIREILETLLIKF